MPLRPYRLTIAALIGPRWRDAGELVEIDESIGIELLRLGHVEPEDLVVETPADHVEPEDLVVETPADHVEPEDLVVETPTEHVEPEDLVVETPTEHVEPEDLVVETPTEHVEPEPESPADDPRKSDADRRPGRRTRDARRS